MLINESKDTYNRETSEYIVAYIDILGATNRIKANRDAEMIAMNKLHNLYTFSMETTKMISMDGSSAIEFKVFSDNVIIAKKLSSCKEKRLSEIKRLLYCASHFQEVAASDAVGWLVRGGIAIGQLYMDNTMVWGNALLKAYYLEDHIAIYPRIVFDQNVVEEVLVSPELRNFLVTDFDGVLFLNYLTICHFVGESLEKGFYLMQDEVGDKLNERILQKLCWHMHYVNGQLDKKSEIQDKKYRLYLKK